VVATVLVALAELYIVSYTRCDPIIYTNVKPTFNVCFPRALQYFDLDSSTLGSGTTNYNGRRRFKTKTV